MRLTSIIFVAASLCVQSANVLADEAKEVFDTLFGEKIKTVSSTQESEDDLELAAEMLDLAKRSGEQEGLLTLLCDATYQLTGRDTNGLGVAAEAMRLLGTHVKSQRESANSRLLKVLARQSKVGKRKQRDAAMEELVRLLILDGDKKVMEQDYNSARSAYRRAAALARQQKHESVALLKAKMESAIARQRASQQIAILDKTLLRDPADKAAGNEIVHIYLIELDDPKAALEYRKYITDPSIRDIVELANKSLSQTTESDCLTLGVWYNLEAGKAESRGPAYHHAHIYLSRFLRLHPDKSSLDRTKADTLLKRTEAAMKDHPNSVFARAQTRVIVIDVPGTHHQPKAITVAKVLAGSTVIITPIKGRWTKGGGTLRGRSFGWKGVPGKNGWLALGVKLGSQVKKFNSDQMTLTAETSTELKLFCADDRPNSNTGSIQVKVEIRE